MNPTSRGLAAFHWRYSSFCRTTFWGIISPRRKRTVRERISRTVRRNDPI
jgi:hypothetical protein